VWRMQGAKRRKKGRVIGGMIMSIRKDLKIKKGEREEKEDIIVRRIKYGKGNLRIWDICEWGYGEEIRRVEGMEEREEGVKTIIGGNLNAKTGREGG